MRRALTTNTFLRAQRGFTLIELLAVLLLLGLLATAVSFSLASTRSNAQMSDVIGQIIHFDAISRADARQSGRPLRLTVSLSTSTLSRRSVEAVAAGGARPSPLILPPDYSIRELRLPARRLAYGEGSLPISPLGQTPSYALLIAGPKEQRQWVFFTGLTSQSITPVPDRELNQLLQPPSH